MFSDCRDIPDDRRLLPSKAQVASERFSVPRETTLPSRSQTTVWVS